MESHPQVIYGKRTFMSQVALGVSLLAVTVTISGAAIVLYGMHIADTKAGDFLGLVRTAIKGLPELRESLPPVLADFINDRRRPDYRSQIDITARVSPVPTLHDGARCGIEIVNRGTELISLLSLRVVAFDEDGVPLFERNEWAATPFAAEEEWPGPLMPGSRRYIDAHFVPRYAVVDPGQVRVEVEITDIRVWAGDKPHAGAREGV